jgi:C1A family cysteine protease
MLLLPESVDLEPQCPSVYNQLQLGSCTANAAGALAQFVMKKLNLGDYVPARLALYYWNRLQEGTVQSDDGASLHDAMNTLVKFGVPNEILYPYNDQGNEFAKKPTKNVWSDGYWHAVKKGLSINENIQDMKSCLAQGYPFIFGFVVYESFESEEVAKTGILNMPKPGEASVGGHAVLACGYDDNTRMFKIRNSWGADWGQKGYFMMPFDYISNPNLASDFWTCHEFVRFKK